MVAFAFVTKRNKRQARLKPLQTSWTSWRVKPQDAMDICAPADFLPSCSITQIGPFIGQAAAQPKTAAKVQDQEQEEMRDRAIPA